MNTSPQESMCAGYKNAHHSSPEGAPLANSAQTSGLSSPELHGERAPSDPVPSQGSEVPTQPIDEGAVNRLVSVSHSRDTHSNGHRATQAQNEENSRSRNLLEDALFHISQALRDYPTNCRLLAARKALQSALTLEAPPW